MVTKELILHFLDSWKHTDFYRCDYYCLPESEQTLFSQLSSSRKGGSTELRLFAETDAKSSRGGSITQTPQTMPNLTQLESTTKCIGTLLYYLTRPNKSLT